MASVRAAKGFDQQAAYSASVSPGFFKFNELVPRLPVTPRDSKRTRVGRSPRVLDGSWITSFNEWGEATAVELQANNGGPPRGTARTWTLCVRCTPDGASRVDRP